MSLSFPSFLKINKSKLFAAPAGKRKAMYDRKTRIEIIQPNKLRSRKDRTHDPNAILCCVFGLLFVRQG